MTENAPDRPVEELSREIDALMQKEDYKGVVERARMILMRSIDDIGIDTFMRASVVFAYSLLKLNMRQESLNVLDSLEKSGMGLVDAYFLRFCIAFEEKNTAQVIEYGKKFIDSIPDPKNPPETITTGVQTAHEVVNNLATALLEYNRTEEAIEILRKGLEFRNDYPLLYVNLGIAQYRNGKAEEGIDTLKAGLEKCEDTGEIYRTLGLIFDELHYYLKAELNLRKAIDKGNMEAHLDLGIMFNKMSKIYDAEEELQEYLKYVPGESTATKILYDIRSLEFYGRPEEKISAALIVKNEEDMIGECIESFREAVDEIVVVDTGSTDRTIEIVKSYNVNLYHHEWKDDFSEARNVSIEKTTGEWVMIIDADERLEREDITRVRALKWQKDYDVLCFAVYSALPGQLGGANFGKHYSPRIFRKSPDIYYYGIVHNILHIPDKAGMTNVRLYHLGYDLDQEKMKRKFERSLKLLKKQVEEQPDDPFVLMNIAQMYLSRNYAEEAEEYAQRCVKVLQDDPKDQEHLLLMALYQLALIYLRRLDFTKSEEYAKRALERKENYLDPLLNLGWCYFMQERYDEAVDALEKFLEYREELVKKDEFNLLIVSKLGSDYEANFLIGEIHRLQGDYEKAEVFLKRAIESNNLYWNVHHSLGKIYMKEGKYAEAADAFENAIKYGYLNAEQYGTTGSSREVYREAIENYKTAIEKDVNAQKSKPSVQDALGRIDDILKNRE